MRPRIACAAAVLLSAGCTAEATQLIVLVDTDYEVPSEVARIYAMVSDAEENEISSQEFGLTDNPSPDMPALFGVPLSFGVVPMDGDPSRRVIVQVEARDVDGGTRVVRRARTGFLPNRTLLLPMFLSRSCEGVMCPARQTCVDGACRDDAIGPETLVEIRPGQELRLDGGPRPDARVPDGAPIDAPVSDAPAPSDAPSSDGSLPLSCDTAMCVCDVGHCDVTCMSVDRCEVECVDLGCTVAGASSRSLSVRCASAATCIVDATSAMDAHVDCEAGATCTVACGSASSCNVSCAAGATCNVDCRSAMSCNVDCAGDSACEVDGRSASSCDLRCPDPGARGLVQCAAASSCGIRACGDGAGVVACGGDVHACGVACP
jgi:hypothetical protein